MKVLAAFPVVIDLAVNWGDMDAYGHVNNANYFRYFEVSRLRYIEAIGLYKYFLSQRIAEVLSKVSCNFIVPIKYPDSLNIGTRVTEMVNDKILMEHFITSSKKGLAAFGESELVIFDLNKNKAIPVPDILKKSIEKIEKKTF